MESVSCIIPAYNEGKRIKNVIKAVLKNKFVDELIIVNDASTDNTKEIIEKEKDNNKKIIIINNPKNMGKTASVCNGLKKSKNNIVMLIDADLINLKNENLNQLIAPVIQNKADISISMRKIHSTFYDKMGINWILFNILKIDLLSGERVFNKSLIKNLDELKKLKGYDLEVYLNKIAIKNKLRVKIVKWERVYAPEKAEKIGFIQGTINQIKMFREIVATIGLFGFKNQHSSLKKLIIN